METDLLGGGSKVLYTMSFEKENFNLKKVLALKKRIYSCEPNETTFILAEAIQKCEELERAKSEQQDKERRLEYQLTTVECPACGKELLRASLYKHKKNCRQTL